MADDLTAELDRIAERAKQATPALAARRGLNSMADSAEDVPRLLAALRAVLEAAGEFDIEAAKQERNAMASDELGGMLIPAAQRARAQTHRDCARTLREAISREITGKGESDGH